MTLVQSVISHFVIYNIIKYINYLIYSGNSVQAAQEGLCTME